MTTKTLIIYPILKTEYTSSVDYRLEEARGLANAISLDVQDVQLILLSKIIPSTFIGSGKANEIKNLITDNKIELVIVDTQISPIQQRNLEKSWNCKVIDRTALIIEIFADRAKTREGKLQVDLAALQYQKTRLIRSWTHLERQRGGFGFIGGPGEKQIESDRRAIRNQIKKIETDLLNVKNMRALHRKGRDNVPYPLVALVGYTNAGKTSLFNRLTGSNQYADDKLFATLDPTMRKINLPSKRQVIISDTVGFISDLPTELVAAFSATLEEVLKADLILHVIDASNPESESQKIEVEKTLSILGIDKDSENILIVNNKIDLLECIDEINPAESRHISLSAKNNTNINQLLLKIEEFLSKDEYIESVDIDNHDAKLLNWIYEHAQVLQKQDNDGRINLTIKISQKNKNQLDKMIS